MIIWKAIGGVDKVVEIDESKFGKQKYHKGHRVEEQLVFASMKGKQAVVFLFPSKIERQKRYAT